MADNTAYLAFLNDPDQASRRAELRDFFGPNADKFLRSYDALQRTATANRDKKPAFSLFSGGTGFCWPAMFTGPVWFFYRKMWAAAWTITGLLLVLSVFLAIVPVRHVNLPVGILLGLFAYRTYIPHAIGKLQSMRGAQGSLDPRQVAEAGGVSVRAGWIAGIVYGLYLLLTLIGVVLLARSGDLTR